MKHTFKKLYIIRIQCLEYAYKEVMVTSKFRFLLEIASHFQDPRKIIFMKTYIKKPLTYK